MFIEIMLLKYCAGNSAEHEQVEFLRSLKLFVFESLGRMAELHLGSHLDNGWFCGGKGCTVGKSRKQEV